MRHILGFKHARRALLLMPGALALILGACGGYGSSSGSGSMACGGAYGGTCPAPTITMTSPGATVNRTVRLTASAAAMGGSSTTRADSLVDGTSVGTASTAPDTVIWA